ncbi:helix-turn-helix domain-containing protein [Kribbella sp. NBC_01510]|uniref:helix-turn-helix domain-containing protein n=1 Tax=Kribbella sp. NBC_01510 TaxID=2903581 RepID=UPI00386CD863
MPAKPEPVDALIAGNVRAIRARRKERQADLAADLGWSPPVVGDLENGRRRVTVADMIKLCRALEVDLHELLHGIDEDDLRALGLDRRRD